MNPENPKPSISLKPIAKQAIEFMKKEEEKKAEEPANQNNDDKYYHEFLNKDEIGSGVSQDFNPDDVFDETGTELSLDVDSSESGFEEEGDEDYGSEAGSSTKYYEIIEAASKNLPAEDMASINANLKAIDEIQEKTVGKLKERGEISEEGSKAANRLARVDLNPEKFTVEECEDIADYFYNKTPEIIDEKIAQIGSLLFDAINGKRERRDEQYNSEEYERIRAYQHKCVQWDRGIRGDVREFDRECLESYPEFYSRYSSVDTSDTYRINIESAVRRAVEKRGESAEAVERMIREEPDVGFLLEYEYITEDDIQIFGPFTSDEILDIERLLGRRWVSATDQRNVGANNDSEANLDAVMGEQQGINTRRTGLNMDLTRAYIEEKILPTRRLGFKNMILASAAFLPEVKEVIEKPKKPDQANSEEEMIEFGKKQEEYLALRREFGWITYYMAQLLDYGQGEMKERFGTTRPVDKADAFLKEAMNIVSNMPKDRADYREKSMSGVITKLDEHLHKLQDLYAARLTNSAKIMEDLD